MKQFLIYTCLLLPWTLLGSVPAAHIPETKNNQSTYALTAQLPKQSVQLSNNKELSLPGLKAYYKGFKIDLCKGLAMLPEITQQSYFSFVITPEIELCCAQRDNSVKYLKRAPNTPVTWFDVTLRLKNSDELNKKNPEPHYVWEVERRSLDEIPERIPEQAIIVLIDPKLISTLQTTEQDAAGTIFLPSLVFAQDISATELETALTFAAISSIDLDTVHTPASEIFTKSRVRDIARAAALAE
ncbi:TPA: hypothetical protein DCW54_01425 [Candidatus Dependentiae bacterium]|nr:MAG: hypothetical protein A2017_20405 [Lentisphaerae bacterium GWF2_44_16]HAU30273.1 hypothetical protein [Candidatus Dependentiae bacterium]